MIDRIADKLQIDKDYLLFLLASVLIGIGQSVDGAILTNYLKENLHMLILERSALEFPRELPGLLVVIIIGLMHALSDVRIAAVGHFLSAVGMALLGIIPSNYSFVVTVFFLYSMGQHIYMPLSNSIGMSFASQGDSGRVLGRISAANTVALVTTSALLGVAFLYSALSYTASFMIGAASYFVAAVLMLQVRPTRMKKSETRFVFKREYSLYYWLCVLYGARKQIFITFGPWVLVDIFKQQVTTMTVLFFIVAVTGIFIKPWLGHLVDRIGERAILCGEAAAFFLVCLGYAFATDLLPGDLAILLVCLCYILDQTLSSVSIARATYIRKIALPADVSATLSLGTSIDHLVTMVLPIIGGLVWYNSGPNGYKYVFLGGAAIAVFNFVSARMIVTSPAMKVEASQESRDTAVVRD